MKIGKLDYLDILTKLKPGVIINFREYSLNFRQKKHLSLNIENSIIKEVIPAKQTVDRSSLEEWYGKSLTNKAYLQLACMNCFRIILTVESDVSPYGDIDLKYKPIIFSQDLYETDFQELEIVYDSTITSEPIYTSHINF